ncbi:MAG: hypothetical protein AAGB22_08780, partial [Bacteroidota bacterium]
MKEHQRFHTKILVHPWNGLTLTNSQAPEPSGATRAKMLQCLLEIYGSWKQELDQLGESHYLKI